MSRISIIIPIYNVETYLEECLKSAVSQTEKDIEIICVEDASTDHSLEIVKNCQKQDPRIRLIRHKTNQGTCKARKDGILAATGEYIMFLDSDDYIVPDACRELYRQIKEADADVMQFGTELVCGENVSTQMVEWVRNFMEPSEERLSGDLVRACFIEHKLNVNLFNKIWKRKCCQQAAIHLTDERLITAEDWYTCFLFLYYMNTYAGTKRKYYCYRLGIGVTGGDILDLKRFEKRCQGAFVSAHVKRFLDEQQVYSQYKDVYHHFYDDILWDCTDCWYQKLKKSDQPEGFNILLRFWSAGEIAGSLARTFFEEQENIEQKIQYPSMKRIAIYYRYIGYQAMDSILKKYIDYYAPRHYEVLLITDTDAPETKDQYMGYRLVHIPAATNANWDKYTERGTALGQILTGIDQLIYLSPTSHVMGWDKIITEAQGIRFQVVMDEYVLDASSKREQRDLDEWNRKSTQYEASIKRLLQEKQETEARLIQEKRETEEKLIQEKRELEERITHIYETKCGKIMRFIQKLL